MYLNKKQKKAISAIIEAIDLGYMRAITEDVEIAYDVLSEMLYKSNQTHNNDKMKLRQEQELEEYDG